MPGYVVSICRLISNARPHHTQTLLQLFFRMFQKSFKVAFFHFIVVNSFINLFSKITLEWTHPAAKLTPIIKLTTTTEFASTGDLPSVK